MKKNKIDTKKLVEWNIEETWFRTVSATDESICSMIDRPDYHRKRINHRKKVSDIALANIFTHMRVNPSKRGRSKRICDCHVFPNARENDDSVDNININYSEASLKRFVDHTIEMASQIRDLNSNESDGCKNEGSWQNTIFCLGEKGVGKTHLQNYILSKYSDVYDAQKVIYIRLNLLRNFGDFKTSFTVWMAAQATKIICRYYSKDSKLFRKKEENSIDYRDKVIEHIDKNYSELEERIARKKSLNIMLKELNEDVRGADISPDWLDEEFADIIWDCAVQQGYTFLIVFDGLDQLTGTFISEEKKELRIRQLTNYLGTESVPKNVFNIIYLRYDTYEELLVQMQEIGAYPYTESMDYEVMNVLPCSPRNIYQKRMNYVLDHVDDESIPYSKAIEFDDFYRGTKCGLRTTEDGAELTYSDAVEYLASDNPRSAIQLMRTSVIQFIETSDTDNNNKLYHFTESAMFGEMIYPPMGYSYEEIEGRLIRKLNHHNYGSFDILFLPSIFSFPYDRNARVNQVFSLVPCEYLLGVRLLQVIVQFEILCSGKDCMGHDLVNFMHIVFGYKYELSVKLLEEFSDYELINSVSNATEVPSTSILDKRISVAIKGSQILEQYVFDLTYLAISGLTFSAPEELVNADLSDNAIFVLKSPKIHESKDWVIAKIINAFSVMKLLMWVNDRQKLDAKLLKDAGRSSCLDNMQSWATVYAEFSNSESNVYSLSEKLLYKINILAEQSISGLEKKSSRLEVVCAVNQFLSLQVEMNKGVELPGSL